jgi:hypothetical protein
MQDKYDAGEYELPKLCNISFLHDKNCDNRDHELGNCAGHRPLTPPPKLKGGGGFGYLGFFFFFGGLG